MGSLIALIILALLVASLWKIYEKAGKPGWAALVPIYNIIVLLEIVQKPIWWIVLFFVPVVNLVVIFILLVELARKFGQGVGFAVGLFFLGFIFYPILGFGDAVYNPSA